MGLKYVIEQNTQAGTTLRAEVLQEGFIGVPVQLQFVRDGAIWEVTGPDRDRVYKPLLPSTLHLLVYDPDGSLDKELAAAARGEYTVLVTENGSTVFKGIVTPNTDRQALNSFEHETRIVATCGLSMLQDIPFVAGDGKFFEGDMSVASIICSCLDKLGLGLDVLIASPWYLPGFVLADPMLEKVFIDAGAFIDGDGYPISCEQVLTDIATCFHLQVRQSTGAWHVVERNQLFSGSFMRARYRNGAYVGVGMFNPAVSITAAAAREWRARTDRQPLIAARKSIAVAYEHGDIPPLISNGTFGALLRGETGGEVTGPGIYPGRDQRGGERRGEYRGGIGGSWRREGGSGRGFIGRYDQDTPQERYVKHWFRENGSQNIIIEPQAGPEGSNAATLKPCYWFPSIYSGDPRDLPHESLTNTGRRFVSDGNSTSIHSTVWTYLEGNRGTASGVVTFPVYYEVKIKSGSLTYWLGDDSQWHDERTYISFGKRSDQQWRGVTLDVWHAHEITSAPVPAGMWTFEIVLHSVFEAIQIKDAINEARVSVHKWASIVPEVRIGETVAPTATVIVARDANARNPRSAELGVRFGDAPVVGMLSSLHHSNGLPTGDWKVGPYGSGEQPSGLSHTHLLAREMFLEQGENVPVYEAEHTREMPRCWPHQVYEIDGVRYQVAHVSYNLLRSTQSGSYVTVKLFQEAPTTDILSEEGAFSTLGGLGDAATRMFVLYSNDVYNRALQNPIAKTTAVIPAGEVTELQVEVLTPIEAKNGLILISTDGRYYQFAAAANVAPGDTVLPIGVYDEETDTLTPGFTVDATVDYPAGIYPRTAEIKSLLIQTRDAIGLIIGLGALALVGEDVEGEVSSIPLEGPLRADVRDGTELVLQGLMGEENQYIIARECEQGAMELPIHRQYVKAKRGQAIKLDLATLMTYLYVRPGEIQMGVEEERKNRGITALTADAIGSGITELQIEPLKGRIAEGSILNLTHPKTGIIQHAVVSSDHDAGENILKIHPETLDMPAGAGIDLAGYYIGSQFIMQRDEINMKVSSDQARATWEKSGETKSLTVLTAPANNTTTIQVAPLPEILPAGSRLKLFFYDLLGLSLFRTLDVTTQTEAAKDAQQIVLTAPVTAPQGALVFYTEGQMLVRLRQAEAGIQVLDNQVTQHASTINSIFYELDDIIDDVDDLKGEAWLLDNRITSAEGRITTSESAIDQRVTKAVFNTAMLGGPVGKTRVAYSGNRTSILIDPILEGDAGLAYSLRRGQVVMIVDANGRSASYARLTANVIAGATTLSIEDPKIPGQPAQIYAAAGSTVYGFTAEPEIERTSLNLSLDGIDVEAKLFKSNDWDGTVDSSGKITQVGTRGWCLSGGGDADITGTLHAGQGAITIGNDGQFIKVGTYHSPTATKVRWESEHGTKHLHVYGGFQSAVPMDSMAAIESPSLYLGDPSAGAIIRVDADMRFYRNVGFYGATPIPKPTVTGTKSGISALASLITQLKNLGLITDNTT